MPAATVYRHHNPHQRRALASSLLERHAAGLSAVKAARLLDWTEAVTRTTLDDLVSAGRALRSAVPGGGKLRECSYFARHAAEAAKAAGAAGAAGAGKASPAAAPVFRPLDAACITPLIRAGAGEGAVPGVTIHASIYDRTR